MGYLAAWKVSEEMILELRKRGVTIPSEVMTNLRSAQSTIRILESSRDYGEADQKIEEYLRSVESYLVSEGQKVFGTEYLDEMLRRLGEARKTTVEEDREQTRIVLGLPRGQRWVRVSPSTELPIERLKTLAQESNLACNVQNDGSVLVCGRNSDIKDFVKKMATEYGSKTRKWR